MANVKITDLPLLNFSAITNNDVLPIVDVDTVVTSKVTVGDLKNYFDSTFNGGTVTGATEFTNGLSANTISATTYVNLPVDVFVTGSSYNNNTFTFTNNIGGTFDVSFNSVTGLTSIGTIESNIISATTYFNTPFELIAAASDETTPITTGTTKVTFRMPCSITLTGVRASLTTAQTSGSTFTVDINQNGSSILSTEITIDNTQKTSTTATIPPVISTSSLIDDDEMTVDVDVVGSGDATGLKITLIGTRV